VLANRPLVIHHQNFALQVFLARFNAQACANAAKIRAVFRVSVRQAFRVKLTRSTERQRLRRLRFHPERLADRYPETPRDLCGVCASLRVEPR